MERRSPTCLISEGSSYLGRRTGTDYIRLNPERLELHVCAVRCIALQELPMCNSVNTSSSFNKQDDVGFMVVRSRRATAKTVIQLLMLDDVF